MGIKSSPGKTSSIAITAVAVMLPNILCSLSSVLLALVLRVNRRKRGDRHLEEEGGDRGPHEITHLSQEGEEV